MELNKIYCGDAVAVMQKILPNDCIDLIVTSPPYDKIRLYNGYIFDYKSVIRECFRVVKPGGRVVWIVGDQCSDFNESSTSFQQALYFKETGFRLNDTMIWNKMGQRTYNPTLRACKHYFDYMFVFSKGKPLVYNEIKDVVSHWAGKKLETYSTRHTDGVIVKRKREGTYGEFQARSNIWGIRPPINTTGHPAVFPESLARDHILMWSNSNDTVLDPLAGSGTTLKAAKNLGRNYIGIELSQEYCDIAEARVAGRLGIFQDEKLMEENGDVWDDIFGGGT